MDMFHVCHLRGQARKSLWIETCMSASISVRNGVRLVRACGSKPASPHTTSPGILVRLVRACGSKLLAADAGGGGTVGQARKSLWIETVRAKEIFSSVRWSGS